MSTDTSVSDSEGREPPRLGALLLDIFASPRGAFAALAVRPVVLWTLLAIAVGNALVVFLYYLEVDFVWFLEATIEATGQQPPPELSRAGARMEAMRVVTGVMAGIGAAVTVLVIMLLVAGYFRLVSSITGDGIPYKRWLALASWSSVPTLLDVLASVVNLALADFSHRWPTEISVLSFGSLLGVDPAATGFLENLTRQTSIMSLWSLVLMVVGYKTWTGKSTATSTAIVAGPLLVIVGLGIAAAVL